jgi:hypothetical protein
MIFLHRLTVGFKLWLKKWTGNRTSNIFFPVWEGFKIFCLYLHAVKFQQLQDMKWCILCCLCLQVYILYERIHHVHFAPFTFTYCTCHTEDVLCHAVSKLGSMKCYSQQSFQCMYKLHHLLDMRYANAGMFRHFRYLIWYLVYISVK